jgi:hypothetical protein
MNLNEIKAAMSLFASKRNQSGLATMTSWLNQGNMFSYARDTTNQPYPGDTSAYVHAYPGITSTGDLVFLVISGYLDTPNNPNIAANVSVYPITTGQPSPGQGGNIPAAEAIARINNWAVNHTNWIASNISAPNSIFQCFAIPQEDSVQGTTHNAFLALESNSSAPGGFNADIIVQDVETSQIYYMDTVGFCPPYGSGSMAASRFYLLSLI